VVALRVREYNATWDETSTSRPLAA
jgi:hypothetical protein